MIYVFCFSFQVGSQNVYDERNRTVNLAANYFGNQGAVPMPPVGTRQSFLPPPHQQHMMANPFAVSLGSSLIFRKKYANDNIDILNFVVN